MRLSALLAVVLVLASPVMSGCVDEDSDVGDGDGPGAGEEGFEDCDVPDFPDSWGAARIECEADVAGSNETELACGVPEEAELTASSELEAGSFVISVFDGEDVQVAEHELGDTGGQARNLTIDETGAEGDWRLVAERLEGFEGSFHVELACPQE